jgi:hypothetical protein
MLLGATSLLSVPISDGETGYGALTLIRQAAEGRFTIADLALATELGEHLGVAIRVDRMFRHRSAVAEALQSSLLPASLPEVPGLDLSAAYVPASEGLEVSGDFYDVFPVQGGWAITVGDVCGKGPEAAAMTAAARHAIRAIAHWNPDPVDVLAGQQPQGGVLPSAAAGIPGPATALLAGQTPMVRVVLRGIGRRGTHLCPAPVHRTAGPAVLTGSCPPAFTTGLKAGALAAIMVAGPGPGVLSARDWNPCPGYPSIG